MEKLRSAYNYLYNVNYAYVLTLGLMAKALISDVSFATFLFTVPVWAFEGYKLYLKSKKPDPVVFDAELRRELDNLKSRVNASNLEKGVSGQPKRYF